MLRNSKRGNLRNVERCGSDTFHVDGGVDAEDMMHFRSFYDSWGQPRCKKNTLAVFTNHYKYNLTQLYFDHQQLCGLQVKLGLYHYAINLDSLAGFDLS